MLLYVNIIIVSVIQNNNQIGPNKQSDTMSQFSSMTIK